MGLVGLGLEAYWEQFEGLQQRLEGYLDSVQKRIAAPSRTVINLGLIDSIDKGIAASHRCRVEDIDILLVYVTTYALSSVLLPVLRGRGLPILLLNLQPTAAIDYPVFNRATDRVAMTGEWLAYCNSCPVPEICNVMRRLDIPFHQVTGMLQDDPDCWNEIDEWLRAGEVVHALEHSRLGLMGHYYTGMLDVATDLLQISGCFGLNIEMLEVDELSRLRRGVEERTLQGKISDLREFFDVDPECTEDDLAAAARTAIALEQFAAAHSLSMMAYYYKGIGISENEDTLESIILGTSMLTARGIPVAGEYEVKNVVAMKILDLLGAGGSFTEYYAADYKADLVLMGHDGPGHPQIASGKVKVRPLRVYHGKVGSGLSVEMSVRHGPVTLLSVVEDRTRGFKFVLAEGESVPGNILQIGNTNGFYRFPVGARTFMERWNAQGPAHHCAIGTGHLGNQLAKIAGLLGISIERVC
ncbi:MAG: arabinose isomerase [Acidobacteriota bacterium]|nr:arabinose isomerase [Acidobacteriota bacterium]